MKFEQDKRIENWGKRMGFLVAFLVFTAIVHLIIVLLKKEPLPNWTYWDTMVITLAVTLIGLGIGRMLR